MPRAAPAGRGEGGARRLSCRVPSSVGRGPPRRGGDPPAAGEAAVPRGRGGHRPDRGASIAPLGGGRARCRSRPRGGGDAVGRGALRDRRAPGERSCPAPGGAGAPCRAVPAGAGAVSPHGLPLSRGQPVGAALAAAEQRARGARWSLGEAPLCLPGALWQAVPAAWGRRRVRSSRSQRVPRWGLGRLSGSPGSSLGGTGKVGPQVFPASQSPAEGSSIGERKANGVINV